MQGMWPGKPAVPRQRPFHQESKSLLGNPYPVPANFGFHLIDQHCVTWVPLAARQAEKAISLSSLDSGRQKKEKGLSVPIGSDTWSGSQNSSFRLGMGVDLTAPAWALSALSRRMEEKNMEVGI